MLNRARPLDTIALQSLGDPFGVTRSLKLRYPTVPEWRRKPLYRGADLEEHLWTWLRWVSLGLMNNGAALKENSIKKANFKPTKPNQCNN
jgi:hypothetical protein